MKLKSVSKSCRCRGGRKQPALVFELEKKLLHASRFAGDGKAGLVKAVAEQAAAAAAAAAAYMQIYSPFGLVDPSFKRLDFIHRVRDIAPLASSAATACLHIHAS